MNRRRATKRLPFRPAECRGWRALKHFQKRCNHSGEWITRAVFLRFGFVSAQLQGFTNLFLRRSLANAQNSSLRIGYNIFSNALINEYLFSRELNCLPSTDSSLQLKANS